MPGIGGKTAQRLAFHILRVPESEAINLAKAIELVRTRTTICEDCGNIAETQTCNICADPKRDAAMLCVVEEPSDVVVLERTGRFRGVYHILGGALAPAEGVGPEQIRLRELVTRVQNGSFREIILATNPTASGEATAFAIRELLSTQEISITRIARGVPIGSDLELADQVTLIRALEGRKEM